MSYWICHLILAWVQHFFVFSIYYYFLINTTYLVLLIAALFSLRNQMKTRPLYQLMRKRSSLHSPPISVIAPAYNEEATIRESIKSFLMLNYPAFEVIVVNDGSKDNTLAALKDAFLLEPSYIPYDGALSNTEVRGVFISKLHPNLIVIDKVNGGKADALNVGIGFSQYDVFCAVDSDSILEDDALLRIAVPFIEDPERTVASGGTIRIANGSSVRYGRVHSAKLPVDFLGLVQIVEYTRAFLCGRIGWNAFNATLVISGAFGLFSKSLVKAVGGYLEGSVGEDMELIVRLHRHLRERKADYSIVFIPDPVCWTEAPNSYAMLSRQRNRWQRGLAQTLFENKKMLFNPKYGVLGLFAFPYYFFVELLGPLVELLALICLIIGSLAGVLERETVILFFAAGFLYGLIMTLFALLIEERYFSKYPKPSQFLLLMAISVLEAFGYHQINVFWRIRGLYDYWRGNTQWGQMKRSGFSSS